MHTREQLLIVWRKRSAPHPVFVIAKHDGLFLEIPEVPEANRFVFAGGGHERPSVIEPDLFDTRCMS